MREFSVLEFGCHTFRGDFDESRTLRVGLFYRPSDLRFGWIQKWDTRTLSQDYGLELEI